jgi:redox-sensitive bicupin YhaK (pirin superfamily)
MADTPFPLFLRGHVTALAGGLNVRRLLPAAQARAVGPFVFFDHFGPVTLPAEVDSDVGPHPHIGLATVSYLFEGQLTHRDSLGTLQEIEPGALNWMQAGRGIVHSERTPAALRGQARALHGLQLWVALPPGQTEAEPEFQHWPAEALPELPLPGARVRVLVGSALGASSPVRTLWPTLYLDVQLEAGAELVLPPLAEQGALYAPAEGLLLDGAPLGAGTMAVLPQTDVRLGASAAGARCVLIGGAALPQAPRMWWNFVAYERETLGAAAARWAADGFGAVPGENGRIAAPEWRG